MAKRNGNYMSRPKPGQWDYTSHEVLRMAKRGVAKLKRLIHVESTNNDKDHVVLVHDDFRGVRHIWFDKPYKGMAIVLRIRTFDAVAIEVIDEKPDPLQYFEQLKSLGWKRATEA